MGFLLIILNNAAHQVEGMLTRRYGNKHGAGGMFFNAVVCLFSMLFFVLTDRDGFYFPGALWIYGGISCLCFATGFYGMYRALQLGSYVISRLISSFSGVLVIFYGLFYLGEDANLFQYISIVLVFLSLFIMNYEKPRKGEEKEKFSLKWLAWVLASLVANAFIAILQREQQIKFDNQCDNEFMILSLGGAFLALLLIGLAKERDQIGSVVKYGTLYGAGAGLMNGAANLVGLWTYYYIPISAASPIRTGVGTVMSFLVSWLIYREKFSKQKLVGVFLGLVAVVISQIG
ncbi:MAG: DMT family transporter [Clostridia bacterium]|nr:DMT family transporter [Clostridia bacterium]